MTQAKRVFVFGAGFSKPSGMPLATDLLPLLKTRIPNDEMHEWLDGLSQRLRWLRASKGQKGQAEPFKLNIEEVFHYANFDIEVHRLSQHMSPVGRDDGPGTPWESAKSISVWMSFLEDALRDVILEKQDQACLSPIIRWAKSIDASDSVLTFNYDTLVERALSDINATWNHGIEGEDDDRVAVFKLHGSIDWIVAHRSERFSKMDLLFDKRNNNRSEQDTGHTEDDCRLWRCRNPKQLTRWIQERDLQSLASNASFRTVGIAGLGAYKQLHQIPGLGYVWSRGMCRLYEADLAIFVGFSMSDFDAMAQMRFAAVARERHEEGRPLEVVVIDPSWGKEAETRFHRVFETVTPFRCRHEAFDWDGEAVMRRSG